MMRIFSLILIIASLSACAYAPTRYSISSSNNMALRPLNVRSVNIGRFTRSADFSSDCRFGAGVISAPAGDTFEGYIQKGLVEEFKLAGKYDPSSPITLTGNVDKLSFDSMRGLNGGTWDIGLNVVSSNGKSVYVTEHYEFDTAYGGFAACQVVADQFVQTTQNIIGKLVSSPNFKSLFQ